MTTNANPGPGGPGQNDGAPDEPEENLATTAYDPVFSSLDFDRDHGAEVELARRELDAHAEVMRHAA